MYCSCNILLWTLRAAVGQRVVGVDGILKRSSHVMSLFERKKRGENTAHGHYVFGAHTELISSASEFVDYIDFFTLSPTYGHVFTVKPIPTSFCRAT